MALRLDEKKQALETLRHSAAHVMAAAIAALYPDVKLAIGPAVEDGFYYDVDTQKNISEDDFEKIENKMSEIIDRKEPFVREEITREKALEIFAANPYKVELINELPVGEQITIYRSGAFVDLCRGPHVEHTGQVKAFKLLKVAGAYWRGSEKNAMLQRLYGTAFSDAKQLRQYLAMLEEAAKRDHRRLGKDLDLFSSLDDYGPGLILWHPKGARIRDTIEKFWKEEHYKNGYELLYSPHIGRATLWETSGHLEFYSESMYSPMNIDDEDYYIKPMNCPFHIMVYKKQIHSYRDLPLRWAELGTVYRFEKSGVLHGLLRVRGFTQDDAHIICTPDQIDSEIADVLRFSLFMWKSFGFSDVRAYLSTRPEKAVGEKDLWDNATLALKKAIDGEKIDYELDEGGGAFYGPKIDLKVKDALGREWQMTTIQFDFNLPERFDMHFIGQDGRKHRPYMVHRALLGSIERFFGVLIEHYAGAFPTWLAPVQARVLPVSEDFISYANEVRDILRRENLRVEVDGRNEKLGFKIRDAQMSKIPYMLVVGEKEAGEKLVSIRSCKNGDMGRMSIDDFGKKALEDVLSKGIA
jgi:threonyl-tRNA synthetase